MLFPALPVSEMVQIFSWQQPGSVILMGIAGGLLLGMIGFLVGLSVAAGSQSSPSATASDRLTRSA